MDIHDICDSDLEGDMLPGLADYLGDYYLDSLNPEQLARWDIIQRRMSDSDYFDTPESAADLEWLKAIIGAL